MRVRAFGWLLGCLPAALLANDPVEVEAARLGEVAGPLVQEISASVQAGSDSQLSAELALPIAEVLVDVGDSVRRGQPLLRLDRRDPQLQLQQATAQRQSAQAQAELAGERRRRGEELAPRGHLSADEMLALRSQEKAAAAALEVAESALALARRQLQKTELQAPFDGEVMARHAQVGDLASPGVPLLRLVEHGRHQVMATLPAAVADQLRQTQQLQFRFEGHDFPLRLLQLGSSIDPGNRGRHARLAFTANSAPSGANGLLRWTLPGYRLRADWLVQRPEGLGVFVLEQERARFLAVPGALPGRDAAAELAADTLLVIGGQQALQDGAAVRLRGSR